MYVTEHLGQIKNSWVYYFQNAFFRRINVTSNKYKKIHFYYKIMQFYQVLLY